MAYRPFGMRVACIALLSSVCTFPQYASSNSAEIRRDFAKLPLYFEQNQGQVDLSAHFVGRGGGVTALVRRDGLTLAAKGRAVSMRLLGARKDSQFTAEKPVEGVSNYYGGGREITGVRHYERVRVSGVRRGIDIIYYGTGREIEYDLVIHAGADPGAIHMRFDGTERPVVDANGDLLLRTAIGDLYQRKPKVWQEVGGRRVEVECRYTVTRSGEVRLILGEYRRSAELVVDPILSFSTYLGGNSDDYPQGIAVDSSGYVYVTGYTQSQNFPSTNGTAYLCCNDVFVTKMNPAGTALVYSTYISNYADGRAIAVDSAGNAYITGSTLQNTFPRTYGQFGGSYDAFVVKLGSVGNLIFSTILGGSGIDDGDGIAVDGFGSAYVVGTTRSSNFPRTSVPLRTTLGGAADAFIAKLQPSGQVSYATNFGGSSDDGAAGVLIDASLNAYVTGSTTSDDFPTTAGSYATTRKGASDAYVTVVNANGSAILRSTYLGGTQDDYGRGIALDATGIYLTGNTKSNDFPTFSAFTPTKPSAYYYSTGFVTKVNTTATALVYSSYLGGNTDDSPVAIGVNSAGAAYVVGASNSLDFPTTPGALRRKNSGFYNNLDVFMVQVAPDGMALTYSTLLGSNTYDRASAAAIDTNQGVYIAGTTSSTTLPTTMGAFQSTNPKSTDYSGFIVKIDMSSPTLCTASANPASIDLPGRGGSFSFGLTLPQGCPWEAIYDSFITVAAPVRGVGATPAITINGTVAINDNTSSSRTGTVMVGNATFTVNQSAGSCTDPIFNPLSASFDQNGGLRSIGMTLPSGCSWTATTSSPWLSINSSTTGNGSATITIYAAPNSFSQRTATLNVASKSVTITQTGGNCTSGSTYTSNFGGAGGTGVVRLTTSPSACNWTANSLTSWIQLSGVTSGQGPGAVPFVVAGNPGLMQRSGQILVADQLITITQGIGPYGTISSYTMSVFAGGNYSSGPNNGDGGPATSATLVTPRGLTFDPVTQNVYIADGGSPGRIRVVTPDGIINTFAGGGASTAENIPATSALLSYPVALAWENGGAIYVTESSRVRKISQGTITTIAGGLSPGFGGDNGPASSALLNNPTGVAVDTSGNVFIADYYNDRVRKVSGGTITTFAGGGNSGLGDNGPATSATLSGPYGLALDGTGKLLIADSRSNRVRAVSQGIITTVAGGGNGGDGGAATSAYLPNPLGVAVDTSNNMLITDLNRRTIRRVNGGIISSLFSGAYDASPLSVMVDTSGRVYFSNAYAPYDVRVLTPVVAFCTYSVSPAPAQPTAGGPLSLTVTTQAGCNWNVSSDLGWATSSSTGTGSGTALITIAPSGGTTRSGTIYVAGQAALISQNPGVVRGIRDVRGTGISDALLYDAPSGQSYTALSNGSGGFSYVPNLMTAGFDILRFCDYNGDGKADLVLYNSITALAYIGAGDGAGHFAFGSLFWSPGYDQVAAGDLNGDGKTDFVLYRSSDGTMYTALSNGDGTFTYKYTLVNAGYVVTVADFSGDGKSDVFLYRMSDGLTNLAVSNGSGGFTFFPLFVSKGYDFVQTGDMSGDGKADLLLYSSTSGAAAAGLSNGSGFEFTPQPWSPGYTSVRLADFNGDGKADVAVYNRNTSFAYLGMGNGNATFAFGSLFWGPGYDMVDTLDLNGDGKMDVILYNSLNAAAYAGIGTGVPANPFTYQYSYWGMNRSFAK